VKSAFLVMTSLWLSGSVSAAETLPVVQVGHHAQAPAGKGQDAAKGGDSKGKGQDAAKGKGQAPQAPCHECKLNLLDKLKARLGDLNLGRKCGSCEVSHKGQAPAGKGQDGKGQDAGKGGKGDSKGAAPMPAKAAPAKQVSTPVPAIPDLKNPF